MIQEPHIRGVDLSQEQACVFSRQGELLWQSPGWFTDGKIPDSAQRAMGFGWHEFIHEDDYDDLMAWFADPKEGAHSFRCMMACSGEWAMWTQYKLRYGSHWLTFGEFSLIAPIRSFEIPQTDDNQLTGSA